MRWVASATATPAFAALRLAGSGHFCVSVTWEIDKIPLSVYEEVVDQFGLSGLAGGHRQFFVLAEHVYEG